MVDGWKKGGLGDGRVVEGGGMDKKGCGIGFIVIVFRPSNI